MYQSRVHDVEELLDIWHGLQRTEQSAVDRAIDGQRVFPPAYRSKRTVRNFQNRLTVDQVIAKSSTPYFFKTVHVQEMVTNITASNTVFSLQNSTSICIS